MARSLFIVQANQLFPPQELEDGSHAAVFMAEDDELCRYVRHHQQKIVLMLSAMRAYRDELAERGIKVLYHELAESGTYEEKLLRSCRESGCDELVHYEVEGKAMERRLARFAARNKLAHRVLESPMFLSTRKEFEDFLSPDRAPQMAAFYRAQRHKLDILLDGDGKPAGGKYSHDADNRKRLPKDVEPPEIPKLEPTAHVSGIVKLVTENFSDHPGKAEEFWWPTTREQAQQWLTHFLTDRLHSFGPYEDALTVRSDALFHSALSPLLNLGLLTPRQVIDAVLEYAGEHDVPLNSLEGFVRQVAGWREFVRGIYHNYSERQRSNNHWNHERALTAHWYEATTGIPPLDDAIDAARRLGWTHHIPRLMVLGNLMTLCEIKPAAAHRWFMEMFVDSANWVMGPNVYGMALFSDGGIFATKPYICGSNYLLKMSDYKKGPWCDTVDGLYWRFIEKHLDFFTANPRLAVMARTLQHIKPERRERIGAAAESFLASRTA